MSTKRRRVAGPGASMTAEGIPMVWLTGGTLALALGMIVLLLVFVFVQGARTFWPVPALEVELVDGQTLMGEPSRVETYDIDYAVAQALPEGAREGAMERLDGLLVAHWQRLAAGGEAAIRGLAAEILHRRAAVVLGGIDDPEVTASVDELTVLDPSAVEQLVKLVDELARSEAGIEASLTRVAAASEAVTAWTALPTPAEQIESAPELREELLSAWLVQGMVVETDFPERRRLLRTGNYELSNTHFNWVTDLAVTDESHPEWAIVVERLTWGRFYGVPLAFVVDDQRVAEDPQAAWELFREHHAASRERHARIKRLESVVIGKINARQEEARLRLRSVEMAVERGEATQEELAAERVAHEDIRAETSAEYQEVQVEIRDLRTENARRKLVLVTADGSEKPLELGEIVRAFPANQLGTMDKVGVYVSRWWEFLTDDPREANTEGGVAPAIIGTVIMALIMTVMVVPFGVLAALYLREYAKSGPIISAVRIAINNLAGVPSIVFGVFGLGFFCYIVGGTIDQMFYAEKLPTPTYGTGGVLWASLTLALLTLPVVIVATEEALAAVPSSMRDGSYACGASKWQTIRRIVLPRAMPGIMTGMILAIARGAGEVAPLMLVGVVKLAPDLPFDLHDLGGSFGPIPVGPLHPERSFMHLGFHIYDVGFQSPNSEGAKPMVYTTTLLLIGIIAVLNLTAIWLRSRMQRKFAGGIF